MALQRRFGIGVVILILLLAAGYLAWWYVLARQLAAGFDSWAAASRAEGWTVEVGSRHIGGWPFAARLSLTDVRLRGGALYLPSAIAWDAAGLDLQVAPLHPTDLSIVGRGEQRIGPLNGPALAIDGQNLTARISLTRPGPPWVVTLEGDGVHARPAGGGGAALIRHVAGTLAIDPTASVTGTALDADLKARSIEPPPGQSWPLGDRIAAIDLAAAITGPVPPPGPPALRARTWEAAGGAATLRGGSLQWGPLDATASGRGGLDASLQPRAEGTAKIVGWGQVLDELAGHRVISDRAAAAAKAVISLLATVPPGGGDAVLTVPFTVRDGVLSIRRIPLLRTPALSWPDS